MRTARSIASGSVVAVVGTANAWLLSHVPSARLIVLATALVMFGEALRASIRRASPRHARAYPASRLLSVRYVAPAIGVPLSCALAITHFGPLGAMITLVVHAMAAHRYRARWLRPRALVWAVPAALFGGLLCALEVLSLRGQEWRHGGSLLHAAETPLQRIVLVEREGALELYLDGELQFSSADEGTYHRALLGPALSLFPSGHRIDALVMGGGDGLATRDLLRCDHTVRVTVVDWDRSVTRLCRSHPALRALNADALADPRVTVIHRDIRDVLAESVESFDLIVGDLTDPDPGDPQSAALVSSAFYASLRARLRARGAIVTHASSLDGAWAVRAIPEALTAAGLETSTYACPVPSFDTVTYVLGVVPDRQ